MSRYKLSPEERAAEKERKDNLRSIMKGLDVKKFDDLKDVFKMMVEEMLENGLDGEWTSLKNGQVSAKIGDKFILSLRYSLPTDCPGSTKSPTSQG